jgi:hypothetical protein
MDITPNNMIQLAHVRVSGSDYKIVITLCVASQRVHIFKYNDRRCSYDVFENSRDANHFIGLPL